MSSTTLTLHQRFGQILSLSHCFTFFVGRKVKACLRSDDGPHLVQVLMGDVEGLREVVGHVSARDHDKYIVCKDVTPYSSASPHQDAPRPHDDGDHAHGEGASLWYAASPEVGPSYASS